MAKTGFATTHALRVEHWSAYFFQYARYKSYFGKFIGKNVPAEGVDLSTDPNNVCQIRMDLSKKKGDKITFPMMAPLRGEGVEGDSTMEDKEEAMTFYDWSVELKQVRNAVRSQGKLSDKRVIFDAKMKAKDALGEWGGHKVDNYCLAALSGLPSGNNIARNTPSTNRIWNGGQTTADVLEKVTDIVNIDSSSANLFGPRVIEAVKRKAQMTEPKIRPIRYNGKDYYVMLIHPYQAKALKASTDWKSGHLYGDVRGEKNALFVGSLGTWDGVIIHDWEKIETRYGEGGITPSEYFDSTGDACYNGIYVARALFLGAQGVVQAWGEGPEYTPDTFDYGNQWGICLRMMMVASKPEFNSEDYGVICVNTAYVPD
jgi:N4-gp56 family major capsid protein